MPIIFLDDIQSSISLILLVAGIALFVPLFFDKQNTWHRSVILLVAGALALRYLWWRVTQTIAPIGLTYNFFASWSLVGIEILSIISSLSAFVILTRVKHRGSDVEAQMNWWAPNDPPRVAVLIATYNEEIEILERTIIGAKALNHSNLEILVLDDGRRDWLKKYCIKQGVRYLTRADNQGYKAGNMNHALDVLSQDPIQPDFIAVLDADFVPHRGFISRTLALFNNPAIGLVQTPQHFYNADPIQHNLKLSRSYPDEQRFFFDCVQPSRDAWGIAFCCGTSSMLRWDAVQKVGGFPTESITEDFMMSLVLSDAGWEVAYLDEPLTEGLAPEGLKEYVTQRSRWCLGMMQIARSRVGPFAVNNLRIRDRWSVLDAVFYWATAFSFRICSLIFPLLYWYFNIIVVEANVADVIRYFAVYYLWVFFALNFIAHGKVIPILNDVSQVLGAIPIMRAAAVGLLKPYGHPFKVTAKGGDRNRTIIQWSLLAPYIVLALLTIFALLIGIISNLYSFQDAGEGKAVLLFWTFYNLLVLWITLWAFVELPREETHINDQPEAATLKIDGGLLPILIQSLTIDTLFFSGPSLPLGTVGSILLQGIGDVHITVIAKTFDGTRLRLQTTPEQKEALILRFYTEGGAPGVSYMKATSLFNDLAKRLSSTK